LNALSRWHRLELSSHWHRSKEVAQVSVFKKMLMVGLGAATVTKEKAEEIVEDLVKRGEVAAGDRAKAIEELQQKAQAAAGEVKKMVDERVETLAKKLKWIDDMRKLQAQTEQINARLDQIEKALQELKGQA
jgi:polyhydroxyalkanoate synthesis regulator phasin